MSSKNATSSLRLATATRKQLPIVKQNLRNKVPLLTKNELRRVRMTFHEALLLEMKEGGNIEGMEFFNEIIQKDLSKSRVIVANKKLTEMIFDDLMVPTTTEEEKIENLLNMGRKIDGMKKQPKKPIDWLVETFYLKAFERIQNYSLVGKRVDAYAKFYYGQLLVDQRKFEEGANFLKESLKICETENWVDKERSTKKVVKLHTLVAEDIFRYEFKTLKKISKKSPEKALEAAFKTLKFVKSFNVSEKARKQMNCEMEIAHSYKSLSDFDKARRHFEHASELSVLCDPLTGVYALLNAEECYKKMQKIDQCEQVLNRAMIHANSDPRAEEAKGFVFKRFGLFWLERKDNVKALDNFKKAVEAFEKVEKFEEAQNVSVIAAIPKTEMIFNTYIEAVLRSDKETKLFQPKRYATKLEAKHKGRGSNDFIIEKEDILDPLEFIRTFVDPDEITLIESS